MEIACMPLGKLHIIYTFTSNIMHTIVHSMQRSVSFKYNAEFVELFHLGIERFEFPWPHQNFVGLTRLMKQDNIIEVDSIRTKELNIGNFISVNPKYN